MGGKYASFKHPIGTVIDSYGRNLKIIDSEYRTKVKRKGSKQYTANEKWYKYQCLNCGNMDWIYESCLSDGMNNGCNACCFPPKKIVKGINDISVTAPWMIKFFKNEEDAFKHSKYSKDKVAMKCPDCGQIFPKQIYQVMSNHGLACSCGDGISYPNKFMTALLRNLHLTFETEKRFAWLPERAYDHYIEHNGVKIITEQHGRQHYDRVLNKSNRARSLMEEQTNDKFKRETALFNGIDYYFEINCSESTVEHIRASIIASGLFEVLGIENINYIDWSKCDEFATSNIAKKICVYKTNNPDVTLHNVADMFGVSYSAVLEYIKKGNSFGWCNYNLNDDLTMLNKKGALQRGQKPVYCETNDVYYRTANHAAQSLSTSNRVFYPRQLRQSITRGQSYLGCRFQFVTQEQFNKIKTESPDKAIGDFFII